MKRAPFANARLSNSTAPSRSPSMAAMRARPWRKNPIAPGGGLGRKRERRQRSLGSTRRRRVAAVRRDQSLIADPPQRRPARRARAMRHARLELRPRLNRIQHPRQPKAFRLARPFISGQPVVPCEAARPRVRHPVLVAVRRRFERGHGDDRSGVPPRPRRHRHRVIDDGVRSPQLPCRREVSHSRRGDRHVARELAHRLSHVLSGGVLVAEHVVEHAGAHPVREKARRASCSFASRAAPPTPRGSGPAVSSHCAYTNGKSDAGASRARSPSSRVDSTTSPRRDACIALSQARDCSESAAGFRRERGEDRVEHR